MSTNETRGRPPREGIRQLATREAMRTLVRRPKWFILNVRQGPEFVRDRRKATAPTAFPEYLSGESEAAASVLGVPASTYEEARSALWTPTPDPDEALTVWNAREELLRLVGAVVRVVRPRVVVETGVALGFTSVTILRAMRDVDAGRLYSVDLPALQYNPDDAVGRAVPPELQDRWDLTLGDSRDVLGPLVARVAPLDVFLHDALHTYSSQLREYRTAWPHLRAGGVLISDDVGNPAFVEFAAEVGARPYLVTGPSRESAVGLLRKP